MPPPMSKTILRMGVPMVTSTRPVRETLPERAKTFVPLLDLVPTALNQSAPAATREGRLAKRLDVVDDRRFAEQPADGGKRGTRARHAAFAFDAVDQGSLFAAHERPRPHLDDHVQVKSAAEDVVAQQAVGLGLGHRRLEPLDGQGIFGANVDIGLRGADGIGGEGHALDEPMRVALDHGPVHERPGIAFIGVADQIFLVAGRPGGRTSTSCPWGNRRRHGRADRSARPCRKPPPATWLRNALTSAL